MIQIDRRYVPDSDHIPHEVLKRCFEIYKTELERLSILKRYYDGEHKIKHRKLTDGLPNNKIIANHAEYITDMATGYVFGEPVVYGGNADYINNVFTEIDEDSHNNDLALDLSIFGSANEIIYMSDDSKPITKLACASPLDGFLVCDTTIEKKPLFGVHVTKIEDLDGQISGYTIDVYTKNIKATYEAETNLQTFILKAEEPHYFADVPFIEYKNNATNKGDFEGVISLIDAYNLLQSDRVNDTEQLVDAFLVIVGQSLGDNLQEKVATTKALRELKVIELDEGGEARWLTKTLNETEIEVLKNSLKTDIHEFSKVPCLTDENFAANSSGVAMKYKLLGFEQLAKTKERYFKQGLRKRLKLISEVEKLRANSFNSNDIDIIMTRSLPVDEELSARVAAETSDFLSWETRLQRFDAEIDVDEEKAKLESEREMNAERQRTLLGFGSTELLSEVTEDAES